MQRFFLFVSLLLGLLCATSVPVLAAEKTKATINIGSKAQLFVDQMLVSSSEGITFQLHPGQKHPANPLLKADQPWEGWRICIYGNVLYDETLGKFRLWYTTDVTKEFPNFSVCYAESDDGIRWTKPLVGTIDSALGSRQHNAVLNEALLPSVIKDDREPDPARRYKMVAYIHKDKPPAARRLSLHPTAFTGRA